MADGIEETDKTATAVISDIAFTPAVKRQQEKRGSRRGYARMEQQGGWRNDIDEGLGAFIESRISFYLATANSTGQPYIQHRGGPPGFLKVLDGRTIGFADYAGNRQYISTGNLTENNKVFLFLMDYANRQRVKIWGTARVVEDDPDLLEKLMPADYPARPERALVINVEAWDPNCPQHIPVMYPEPQVAAAIQKLQGRIAELEAALAASRGET